MSTASTGKIDFKALLAKVKADAEQDAESNVPIPTANPGEPKLTAEAVKQVVAGMTGTTGMHGEVITYNPEQQQFIDLASAGTSCVLIGAAGTGKTTCSQGAIAALLSSTSLAIPTLHADGHRHLKDGTPGVVICSYTRRAVNNIRKVQSEDLKNNCITVHKLLEYAPIYYEIEDPETGELKNTMRFEATRNAMHPLPSSIHTIIIEEASMLGTGLFQELCDALDHKVQFIFIGDIQQLPPVFGPAILGFKMIELDVIELTQVYRQALESPIIRLAHQILSGEPVLGEDYPTWHVPGQLTIHAWKKKLHPDHAVMTLAAFFRKGIDTGLYDPNEDMILMPFNKACGTLELNKHIANHLARARNTLTYEVIAGFVKVYLSEGDRVLYDREDAEIIEILPNPGYSGAKYQPASRNLDYWGHNPKLAEERAALTGYDHDLDDVDFLLEQAAASDDRVNQASHKIVVKLLDSESEVELTTAGDVNALLHAYALTVHKAQGSEWRKVFLGFHQSHAVMMQRELLYTAVTRAREELYVICEPETFTKGIISQRIKGDTLAEKAEFFKGKQRKLDAA